MVRLADKPIFMAIIDIESGDQMSGADVVNMQIEPSSLFSVLAIPNEINALV